MVNKSFPVTGKFNIDCTPKTTQIDFLDKYLTIQLSFLT